MFLIFTKENCLSSIKAISFLKEDAQIYKEVNTNISFIDKDHLSLLEKATNNNLQKFIREKSEYIINNNINWKTLTNEEAKNILSSHLKDVASFPIIVQLSFDGRARNCMIGFSQKILSKWINDENIKDSFVDVNKVFGTDECCYLDKKEKMISTFKKINSSADELRLSLSNLYELKRKNNSNMGVYEKKYDELELLKDDTERLHEKYENAMSKINENNREPEYINFNDEEKNIESNESVKLEDELINDFDNENNSEVLESNFIDDEIIETTDINENEFYEKSDIDENEFDKKIVEQYEQKNNDDLIEVVQESNNGNTVIDDTNDFITPIDEVEKEKDYSFNKEEYKYDEYIAIDDTTVSENSSIFIFDNKNEENKNHIVNDDEFIIPIDSNENVEPEISIVQENDNDSDFITIDLSNDDSMINYTMVNNQIPQQNNQNDISSIDWLEKYELNDQEINHQKEVDNAK